MIPALGAIIWFRGGIGSYNWALVVFALLLVPVLWVEKAQTLEWMMETFGENTNVNREMLFREAVKTGVVPVATRMLEKGIDPNLPFHEWCGRWCPNTAVNVAAIRGDDDMVRLLIARGADINGASNDCRHTPLMDAAERRHLRSVEILLESGADPSAKNCLGYSALGSPVGEQIRALHSSISARH